MLDLNERLAHADAALNAEELQAIVYEVGKSHPFENLRDWFKALYEVLFGESQGPRFGLVHQGVWHREYARADRRTAPASSRGGLTAMTAATIYKLLTRAEWEAARTEGVYRGSAHDLRDGFIHFSTAAQLGETARKYFAGVPDLVLLVVDVAALNGRPAPGTCPFSPWERERCRNRRALFKGPFSHGEKDRMRGVTFVGSPHAAAIFFRIFTRTYRSMR